MHMLRGRDFTDADRPGAKNVAIISQSLAEKFWPGEDPIGRRIGAVDPLKPEWSEVIGVTNDIKGPLTQARYETSYQIYRPWYQDTFRWLTFSLRTNSDPHTFVDGARHALAQVEPDIAITFVGSVQDAIAANLGGIDLVRQMLGAMAVLGLLLSVIGIYGVVANLASERTQEVGVRMALGAQSSDVQWLFMRSGVLLSLMGTGIGLLLSVGLVKVLDSAIEIIPGDNPWDIAGVGAALASIALLACWIPAWRATKVDPTVSLRAE
jgi:hypothetical protein